MFQIHAQRQSSMASTTMMSVVLGCDATSVAGVASLVLLLLSTSYFVLKRKRSVKYYDKRVEAPPPPPPMAGGAWPLIGHLHLLCGSNMPHKILSELADKYGPLFSIRFGSRPTLVISSWEMAKQCFTTHDLAVANRPPLIAIQRLSFDQAMFGFAPYGPYWQQLRKIAILNLLSNRRIQLLTHVRVSEVESSIKRLFQLWLQKKNHECLLLVDVSQCFRELTMNVIFRTLSGKRCFGGGGEVEEEEGRRMLKSLKEMIRLLGVFVVGDALPYLRWLDFGGHEKQMIKTAKELDSVLEELLEEHRRKRASGDRTGDQHVIDVMLSLLDGSQLGGYDADTIIKATTSLFIAGAVDTTSVTLIWAMCRVLSNRHVLMEAQKELDIQIGKERFVKESDLSKLVYLQAIVKETLRLHPPASLSSPRSFREDCIIGNYHVKKGTQLITNLWKIQTDPRIWEEPLEFKPERFLTTHKDVDVRGHHFELIPFGSGRRICPGISFALQTIHLILASFLHSFEFSKPSDEPIDMSEVFGLVTAKATPLEALIKPRLSSNLYDML